MGLGKFHDYIIRGIVRKTEPDRSRAEFLAEDSEKRELFLNDILSKISITDDNANYILESCYDILIGLIRAKMLLDGYNASGNYSHEAEVSYMLELKFSDYDINLMDELRKFRNGIKYYGKRYNMESANNMIMFTKKIYPKLRKMIT